MFLTIFYRCGLCALSEVRTKNGNAINVNGFPSKFNALNTFVSICSVGIDDTVECTAAKDTSMPNILNTRHRFRRLAKKSRRKIDFRSFVEIAVAANHPAIRYG